MDCWHHEIEEAISEAQIVQNAGEYLLLWAPRDFPSQALGLPRMRIESGEDVQLVSTQLVNIQGHIGRNAPGSAHLRELAEYFGHAARRLGELRHIPPPSSQARPSASL